jgi:hypothetical protein
MSRRTTKASTRLRVTRIAAAAVIATGASLTAVGAAQAVTNDGVKVQAGTGTTYQQNVIEGVTEGTGTPTPTPTDTTPAPSPTETTPAPTPTDTTPEPTPTDTTPTPTPTDTSPTDTPTPTPTQTTPTTTPTTPGTGTSTGTTAGTSAGTTAGTSAGTSAGTTAGTGSSGQQTGGNGNTCTLTGDSVDCGNSNTSTDNTQPVTQNKSTTQLAETGSNGTTFMLIGAATLIAGGVGFRLTPRLANRRDAA